MIHSMNNLLILLLNHQMRFLFNQIQINYSIHNPIILQFILFIHFVFFEFSLLLLVCDFFWKYYSSIFFSNSKDSQQDQYYRQLQSLFISILCEWKKQRNVFAHYCFLESFFSSSLYTVFTSSY